jgi:RNA polymerase sigma-70 factor (ECF subfamily)
MQPDDAAAVALARDGDQAAFRSLVERHGRSIYRIAVRIAGRHEDAEDVVQETFVRAYRQLDRFEARANFSTWLYRIGFNCAIDHVRARRHREIPSAPEVLHAMAPVSRDPSTEDVVYGGQISERVHAVLGDLTPQERAAFVMRHFHGCSIDEICRALDIAPNAAKHAVFRAVKKMRTALRPLMETRVRLRA